MVRWRFSIGNQWSASAGLKVQRREIDLDSRYWLSQSDLVQGTPGTATVFAMQNREPPGLLADETGAHTPYVLFHRRTRPPCRATTHGYVRLFRYADDPSSESEKEKERREDGEGRALPSVFLLGTSQRESRVCAQERVLSAPLTSRTNKTSPPPLASPEKTPPRYMKGAYCWPLSEICMSTHFSTLGRIGWS